VWGASWGGGCEVGGGVWVASGGAGGVGGGVVGAGAGGWGGGGGAAGGGWGERRTHSGYKGIDVAVCPTFLFCRTRRVRPVSKLADLSGAAAARLGYCAWQPGKWACMGSGKVRAWDLVALTVCDIVVHDLAIGGLAKSRFAGRGGH